MLAYGGQSGAMRLLPFTAAVGRGLRLIVNSIARPKMSDTGLTVPDMTELPRRYDVTITVDRDGGDHPDRPSSPWRPGRRHQPELPAS